MLLTTLASAQQEASVWYFGKNAGLKFETNGSVTPLSDGQLNTDEGCSSIADVNGNLLFYTDGRTVWDRNHVQMPNGSFSLGTELYGDASSTQSGIIVPQPGSSDLYYIFTVDEPHHENAAVYPNAFSGNYVETDSGVTPTDDDGRNNGLNYSIVDLSVMGSNGSIGNITSRNNHLVTYDPNPAGEEIKYKCSEKITAIKNEADGSYWVITHFINRFYAFKVTASGVSSTPVISTLGSNQTLLGYRRNAIGYLKASPDGTKLAISHKQNGTVVGELSYGTGGVELFDFDGTTGIVSNGLTVIPNVQGYGVEFSPNSEKLYATYRVGTTLKMELAQLDLTSPDIPNSRVVLFNQDYYLYALQLAPNNKIYCATSYVASLGVINSPDAAGLACNYVHAGQTLASGKLTRLGLPPFITSYFNASFLTENLCFGSSTQFTISTSQNVNNVSWDFGDGSPLSNTLNPTHQYANPGDYTVTLIALGPNGAVTKSKTITISVIPTVANIVTNQSVCASLNAAYDLSQHNGTLLGSQSTALFGVAYFSSLVNASNHFNVLPLNYSLPAGITTFYAKVYNLNNTKCYAITSFTVTLFQKPTATTPASSFVCDDSSNDGLGIFNLGAFTPTVLGSQNSNQFTVSYHLNQNDADTNSNALSLNYQNSSNPQTIYVRVENNQSHTCFSTTSFQIGLYKMAVAYQPNNLYACDIGNDGKEPFDLSLQTATILGLQTLSDFSVSYHATAADANSGINPLNTSFSNTVNPQTIVVRVENKLNATCFATTSFQLQVKAEPILNLNDSYTICDGSSKTISAPAGFSSYTWSNGDSSSSTVITAAGNYYLTVTKDYGTIICSTTTHFVVNNSNPATITNIDVKDWTDNENIITVGYTGDGDYEFSIDGIHYQDSSVFSGLSSGEYTVYVNDKKGCGYTTKAVYLLMYPKFFTPNGDGVHDEWRVKLSEMEPNMELLIFDRYGKIITGFKGKSIGWDGTLNGRQLPADDYWFVVKRQSGILLKGHFSLLR
ncbi:T9SS type B sorting domain-containing protein [Flavobacterium silvisoli]|uniref:T9SS type B sorting domain-containing protein n=1 Tax=Flavobacterium silvisoli TaxID=2529433 RepID=A0A4Q9YX02_9FLAO|nr:T9SS type B sorting domain-containing protein [Flavobacterium silvisoli]TBX68337.1 T9SS type B sorting domain-containing protein [Flavobacterium silvisoli]